MRTITCTILSGLLFSALAAATPAFADTYNFDVSDPGRFLDLTFSLPSSPTGVNVGSDFFEISSVPISVNGATPVAGNIFFIQQPPTGGLYLTITVPSIAVFDEESAALFTGTLNAPTFQTGIFLGADDNDPDQDVITVTISPAPAPEPSSLLLLGTGALGIAGAVRRRLAL